MPIDFRASQIQTNKIIASGSTGTETGAQLVVYPYSANDGTAPNQGYIDQTIFNTGSIGTDIFLFVSGGIGDRNVGGAQSISVFGGDVYVSGNLAVEAGFSASLQQLPSGIPYLLAGPNVTITTNSLGQVEVSSSGGGGGGSSFYRLEVLDYAAVNDTSSTTVGQVIFPANQFTGSIVLHGIVANSLSTATGSIQLYNVTSGSYVEIGGPGITHLSVSGTNPTIITSVDLISASNFNSSSQAIYELQVSSSNAGSYGFFGGFELRPSGSFTGITYMTSSTYYTYISGTWEDGGNKLATTSSVAIAGNHGTGFFADNIGGDVFFYVSGNNGGVSAGNGVALFGGDVVISGTLYGGSPLKIGGAIQQGQNVVASGDYSHAEGTTNTASGYAAHAEGGGTIASGAVSHAEGADTVAYGDKSHAEGQYTLAYGIGSHSEGYLTTGSGNFSHAEGTNTNTIGTYSHAEGDSTISTGDYSHAEGAGTEASGLGSHAEGLYTLALGSLSHAEGYLTTASFNYAHAEGYLTIASGEYSHAEGRESLASGRGSHAAGYWVTASGDYSNAQGIFSTAAGAYSLAVGASTVASGNYSFAAGDNTIASGSYQAVFGTYNKENNSDSLFVIGNGNISNRNDIFLVNPATVLIGSASLGSDVFFFVSGSSGSKDGGAPGVAVFGGDVVISGALHGSSSLKVATTLRAEQDLFVLNNIKQGSNTTNILNTTNSAHIASWDGGFFNPSVIDGGNHNTVISTISSKITGSSTEFNTITANFASTIEDDQNGSRWNIIGGGFGNLIESGSVGNAILGSIGVAITSGSTNAAVASGDTSLFALTIIENTVGSAIIAGGPNVISSSDGNAIYNSAIIGSNWTITSSQTYAIGDTINPAAVLISASRGVEITGQTGFNSGLRYNPTIVTTLPHTASLTDYIIAVSASAGSGIELPASEFGKVFIVKDVSGSAAIDIITITAAGGEQIDGASSAQIGIDYGSLKFVYFGAGIGWGVV